MQTWARYSPGKSPSKSCQNLYSLFWRDAGLTLVLQSWRTITFQKVAISRNFEWLQKWFSLLKVRREGLLFHSIIHHSWCISFVFFLHKIHFLIDFQYIISISFTYLYMLLHVQHCSFWSNLLFGIWFLCVLYSLRLLIYITLVSH